MYLLRSYLVLAVLLLLVKAIQLGLHTTEVGSRPRGVAGRGRAHFRSPGALVAPQSPAVVITSWSVCAEVPGRGSIWLLCAHPLRMSMPSLGLQRHKVKGPKNPPPAPERIPPRPPAPGGLRIAFLVYRGNPRCGGQGVYTRHLTRELVELGHSVEVFAGQPWPEVDEGVGFTPVPSLDLYRDPDPFRMPRPRRVPQLLSDVGRRPRVRRHVHRRLPRAVDLQHPGPPHAGRPAERVRPGPRQPVPGLRHPGDDGRRLAAPGHPPPPDHRRPAAGPQPRHQPVAAADPAPLVRLPAHAGQGGPVAAPGHHGVPVVEDGHPRPDGRGASSG